MFFARFEEEEESGAAQQLQTQGERLQALKQKIAAKQRAKIKETEKATLEETTEQHPTKRRKIKEGSRDTHHPLKKKREVISVQAGEVADLQRKKKKKAEGCQEVIITRPTQTKEVIQEQGDGKHGKIKRKRRNLAEQCTAEGEQCTAEGEQDSNETCISSAKHTEALYRASTCTGPPPLQHTETKEKQSEENVGEEEKKEEEEDRTNVEKKEEEWTILGKHKTVEKVGRVKRDLPDWIVNCQIIDSDLNNKTPLLTTTTRDVATTAQFDVLDDKIVDVLKKIEITSLFPIQSMIIPDIVSGCCGVGLLKSNFTPPGDLCVSAPTGSGKTLVYVLSLVQCLHKLSPMLQAIVVVPTKNLANQVKQVFNSFDKLIKVVLLSGKDTFPTEQRHLYSSAGLCLAHVAVTTPGRLVNHLRETKHFTLQHLRFLIIDEMDTLLNQTYQDWLPTLYNTVYNTGQHNARYTPASCLSLAELKKGALPLQKLLFSATVTYDPSKLAPLQLYAPKLYSCGGKYNLPSTLTQYQIRCKLEDKALVLIHLVRKLKHVLCFTSAVDTAHRLALLAEEHGGVTVGEYSSTLTTQQRNKVVRDFSLGKLQLLVCSDSLARGMDLSLADHVVNYDVPAHVQTYVHRVGRTARAGRPGSAFTLLRYEEIRHFHQLLKKAGDTRATEMHVPESVIAELSQSYPASLELLETRLRARK